MFVIINQDSKKSIEGVVIERERAIETLKAIKSCVNKPTTNIKELDKTLEYIKNKKIKFFTIYFNDGSEVYIVKTNIY